MSRLGAELLEAVRADPSDASRLVYADWLEDRGDTARAAFVRTQLERARLPWWDARATRLELEERALLAQHEAAWRAELPELEGVTWGSFRRGFVDKVAFEDTTVLDEHLPAVLAAAPVAGLEIPWPHGRARSGPIPGVRALTVRGRVGDDLDRLVGSALLEGLEELTLAGSGMDGGQLRRLLASADLGALTALRLPSYSFGNDGVSAIVEAGSLGSLTELDLSTPDGDALDEDGIRELATWPGFPRLRSLDLTGHRIGVRGLSALLSARSDLKALHVWTPSEDGEEMDAFRSAPPALRLEELSLRGIGLDLARAGHLADAACLSELRVLRFGILRESEPGAFLRLAGAPWLDGLRVLDFAGGQATFLPLLLARAPRTLHTLRVFPPSRVASDVRAALASSPGSNGLLSLELNLPISSLASDFARATALEGLLWLRLGGDPKESAVDALVRSPLGQRLIGLDIGGIRRLPRLGVAVPHGRP